MDLFVDWEDERDGFSFEDSDRFEDDSLCSWASEQDSLCNNWRGWRKASALGSTGIPNNSIFGYFNNSQLNNVGNSSKTSDGQLMSLAELSAKAVAYYIPFETVEKFYPPIPEQLQLRIAFWSFPENEDDIRLYSCLANGSSEEFSRGESHYKNKCLSGVLQIGFHLSGTVTANNFNKGSYNVAIVFDRKHITSCTCTCSITATWCSHVVALCLFRIHQANQVCLRAPVSETLSRLQRDQLQKFAQYLISELPQQILPTAQRLLDELLSSQRNDINTVSGAPDPTAGPSASEQTTWCLDEYALHENIKKTLGKFCLPSPLVLSDVNYLSSSAPPAASEWQSLLRPLRGREPEGIWNLLLIIREMYRRRDENGMPLLEILTEELIDCDVVLTWWYNNKMHIHHHNNNHHHGANHNNGGGAGNRALHNNNGGGQACSSATQYAAASVCDELVSLWKCSALNPLLPDQERESLYHQLKSYHAQVLEKLHCRNRGQPAFAKSELEIFVGFKPAIEVCKLDWDVLMSASSCPTCFDTGHVSSKSMDASNGDVDSCRGTIHNIVADKSPNSNNVHKASCSKTKNAKFISPTTTKSTWLKPLSKLRDISLSFKAIHSRKLNNNTLLLDPMVSNNSNNNTSSIESTTNNTNNRVISFGMSGALSFLNMNNTGRHNNNGFNGMFNSNPLSIVDGDFVIGNINPPKVSEFSAPCYFADVRNILVVQEAKFAIAESLYVHGYISIASGVALELAEEMLAAKEIVEKQQQMNKQIGTISSTSSSSSSSSLPGVAISDAINNLTLKDKRKKISYNSSAFVLLSNASFLCNVLLEDPENHHVAFKIGLYALEMHRPPAASKQLEVKLAHQESELAMHLKKIQLTERELMILRDRAQKLKDGRIKSRGDALLPITLASFIFDSLCLSSSGTKTASAPTLGGSGAKQTSCLVTPADELLGFEAAVVALGLKANVSEAEYPLLCEGTRRQKGELAVAMLVRYKDDPSKLARIMDKLLDREIHQLYKTQPAWYSYLNDSSSSSSSSSASSSTKTSSSTTTKSSLPSTTLTKKTTTSETATTAENSRKTNEEDDEDDVEGSSKYKEWELKFRCTNLKTTNKKPSVGPDSDSGSSSQDSSSDSNNSDSVRAGVTTLRDSNRYKGKHRVMPSLPNQPSEALAHFMFELAKTVLVKAGGNTSTSLFTQYEVVQLDFNNDNNNNNNNSNNIINNTSNNNNVTNTNNNNNSNSGSSTGGPHRALHLCAFQIFLYGLGVYNCVSPNWFSRTFSSHVSWVSGQAGDIGTAAIKILIQTWENHLTPQETALIADRASRCRDTSLVAAAAELALSCLPYAYMMNTNEIFMALNQCEIQSSDMLQRACLSIEKAAKDSDVHYEILFGVAKKWYDLYKGEIEGASFNVKPSSTTHNINVTSTYSSHTSTAASATRNSWGGYVQPQSIAGTRDKTTTPPTRMQFFHQQHAHQQPPQLQHLPVISMTPQQQQQQQPQQQIYFQPAPLSMAPQIQPDQQHMLHSYQPQHQQQLQQQQPHYLPQSPHSLFNYLQLQQQQFQNHPFMGHTTYYTHQHPIRHPALHNYPPNVTLTPIQLPPVAYLGQQNLGQINQQPQQLNNNLKNNSKIWNPQLYDYQRYYNIPEYIPITMAYQTQQPPPPLLQQQQQRLHAQQQQQTPMLNNPLPSNTNLASNVDTTGGILAMTGPAATKASCYLLAAYRVGMLAMEAVSKRIHEDRPQVKFSRNPSYGEDVKWLLEVTMEMGPSYIQHFITAAASLMSPFILFDIIMEVTKYLNNNSSGSSSSNQWSGQQQLQNVRIFTNVLQQKCLQAFSQCAQSRIHHICPQDFDDFASIICSAKKAFLLFSDNGQSLFNDLLSGLRKSKSYKKELWQRIMAAVNSNSQ
ncbi:hypothetical protein HELRODRAFT_190028 [Helobdella robusta]|uniref:SWIM-type domain-containing protein n=1 Tax=Helobdella robusta TaxID=6412 RepID=T1FRL9_HELRO|nr:hypothetical protein HELRODRAFT_190028 [Helobdella robusta]ESO11610.1 hypothetical protein HELRODRAFT_190028 [Helobdella robusta]